MRARIRCPFHNEQTASLVKTSSGWWCYGACNKAYTNKDVEGKTGNYYEEAPAQEKEDLNETFDYIATLPQKEMRGLQFAADSKGYYICWPNREYYKLRLFTPGRGPKYIGPSGIKPPLFWARKKENSTLLVAEGEVNALSIASALPEVDVCSPGSATMFSSNNLLKYLHIFKSYSTVIVVLDNDAAGTKGLIEAKAFFLYKIPFIHYILLSPDPNEVLIEQGKEALRKKLQGTNSL